MKSIRKYYEIYGVKKYYENFAKQYKNPKENIVNKLVKESLSKWNLGKKFLDLCCGSGEITRAITQSCDKYSIIGLDPYTSKLYKKNTGKECLIKDFDDILKHGIQDYFDTIFCSFALHLCEESKLKCVLWQLSLVCDNLVIITPHKRPDCDGISFELIDSMKEEDCTIKLYKSKNFNIIKESECNKSVNS